MLQWMGGSRRKVTTSRKSTQKRQKQYFEQRKRQQQQQETALTDDIADSSVPCDHPKRNRSLDILSLLNVSKIAGECKPLPGAENVSNMMDTVTHSSCVEDMDSSLMKKSKAHAYLKGYPTSSTPINATDEQLAATESTVPTETRGSSLHQMGRLSSKSYRGNSSYGKNMQSEYFNSASSIQPSIFDIIGDDEKFEASKEEPAKEDHVAFSIEGLGTVGTETPMQSPEHPGSKLHGKQSSFTKAAKIPKSVNNFNAFPEDFAKEMERLMHDVEKPSCQHNFSGDGLYHLTDNELATFEGDMQLDDEQCKMNSLYHENRHDFSFGVTSSLCFNDYEVDENFGGNLKKCDGSNSAFFGRNDSSDNNFGVNLKKCDGNYSSYRGRNDLSHFPFGRFHTPLRRQGTIPDEFNYIDGDSNSTVFGKSKYPSSMFNYQPQDHFFSFKLDDMQDNLTSFSGESCSSTAVEGESTADYTRYRRKYGKDLEIPLEYKAKEDIDSGMWNRTSSTLKQGEECFSRKHIRSGSSHPKTAFLSEAVGNEHEGCLFEGDFPLPNKNSPHESSFFTPFEKTRHRSEYTFGLDRDADFHKSKYFSDASQKDISIEFSSENFGFHQPFCSRKPCDSSFIPKAMYEESSFGVHDFEVHVQSSNSPEVSRDDVPVAELSAQGSVTEEVGNHSKSQPSIPEKYVQLSAEKKYMTPESSVPTRETALKDYGGSFNPTHNCASQDVSEHVFEEETEDTSLSHSFTLDPDDKLSTPPKELQCIIPALCQQEEVKVYLDDYGSTSRKDAAADNLKGPEPKTTLMDPCYQLMTVERYVFKLFSVPKGKAAVWNATNLF